MYIEMENVILWTIIITMMDICKTRTPGLKALNKHNTELTHIMYIEMGNVIRSLTKAST